MACPACLQANICSGSRYSIEPGFFTKQAPWRSPAALYGHVILGGSEWGWETKGSGWLNKETASGDLDDLD